MRSACPSVRVHEGLVDDGGLAEEDVPRIVEQLGVLLGVGADEKREHRVPARQESCRVG